MNHLPKELRVLVKQTVALLGEVICRERGPELFSEIESLRKEMAGLRGVPFAGVKKKLASRLGRLRDMSPEDRFYTVHAFTLMLELMNACENAYRTRRIRQKLALASERPLESRPAGSSAGPKAVIYVLTAHPTEARSPANIALFHEIQELLSDPLALRPENMERLRHLLELVWRLLTARPRKPTLRAEAEHIYSILLNPETIDTLLTTSFELAPLFVRTWVGGDKDGHPGVDRSVMRMSLQLARERLVRFASLTLREIRNDLALIHEPGLLRKESALSVMLGGLRRIKPGDGARVLAFQKTLREFSMAYAKALGAQHPRVRALIGLVRMFPALVVPLELRESSELITAAADGAPAAIVGMLKALQQLSRGGDPRWYARGLIISMASHSSQVLAACRLVIRTFGALKIPVIPLFEQRQALLDSRRISQELLKNTQIRQAIPKYWGGHFEVMLGYSDSAKEMGVLASRIAISKAMHEIDALCTRQRVTPLFFNGSGGSVDRGGGSIREQTAWWSPNALRIYKATVQGEMVERGLASPEIIRSALEKIVERTEESSRKPATQTLSARLRVFADRASHAYQAQLSKPEFLEVIQKATAYRYLSVLHLGSRPSKRGGTLTIGGLRAIPWVLSWTQTRVLFPTWWGVGSAWREADAQTRRVLAREFKRNPLFGSFVKLLGFTLAKVELPIWELYLERSGLSPRTIEWTAKDFRREYADAVAFVRAMSGRRDLLWFRPWLGESIRLRSPMIHPLNLIQIFALEENNPVLIRETATGIASGMMTTG